MGLVRNHDHVNACAFRKLLTLFKMTISTQFVALQVLTTLHSTVEALNTATNKKAASQYVNCDCQCSSLTFQDKFGRTQGNCKTADNTGATWCYVDSRSPCLDKQRSVRFSQSGHAWSYQACSTPPRHSVQCSGFGSSSNFLWVAASQVLLQASLYLDLDHTEAAEALEAAAVIRQAASRTAATVRTATWAAAA